MALSEEEKWVKPRKHQTSYDRTVVIGDLHGDMEAFLSSLAEKRVIRYTGRVDSVLNKIKTSLGRSWSKGLEAKVIRQNAPMQLVFLGDLFDRWKYGCHIVQYLSLVRWERFNIHPVFILGNHDLHNFHFFTNPYQIYEIYGESELGMAQRLEYFGSMGLADSLQGFMDLHRDEIVAIQKKFYRTGSLEWDLSYGKITLTYENDLSFLIGIKDGLTWKELCGSFDRFSRKMGFQTDPEMKNPLRDLIDHLGEWENPKGRNWWNIRPPAALIEGKDYSGGYSWNLLYFNLFHREEEKGVSPWSKERYYDVLLVDWRVISLIWRKYYGPYFRKLKQMHLEGDTLYVHGGLSPRVMTDNNALGIIYRQSQQYHIDLSEARNFDLSNVVDRCNRLTQQVLENCLNDLSYRRFCGTEVFDGMGVWRGARYGFSQFGCAFWADFEYLKRELQHESIQELYRSFIKATGLKRVICGHTRFDSRRSDIRYLMIRQLEEMGMDYLCVDNSCSKGYSGESKLNGIEINAEGRILERGKYDHLY